ncbi:MAG: branched-chain amino acid aminotransferase [Gammaproteobacteria bacterium]|nr:branched-chain amino acid aminotransferase [Gammaproteobacteria bacterium]
MPARTDSLVADLLATYRLPEKLTFGVEMAPVMYRAEYRNGEWLAGALVPFADVPVNPASTALQFAQQCFEGMKAYKGVRERPVLFRPDRNRRRFASSAERLLMPEVPAELFAEALSSIAGALAPFTPAGRGQSLYLRPTLFGLDPHFAVKGSDRFLFLVLASPSDAYYAEPIRIMIERANTRAAAGGTGAVKVGGNYAASLLANRNCAEHGFDQSLWLDPVARRNIEELSAMNFMSVIDGQLHTPALSGSLLEGVTRDSLLALANHLGMEAVARPMPIDELLSDIVAGRCTELFACGTGAIVAPIRAIGEADGRTWSLRDVGVVSTRLRDALLDIQEGKAADTFNWTVDATDPGALNDHINAGTS